MRTEEDFNEEIKEEDEAPLIIKKDVILVRMKDPPTENNYKTFNEGICLICHTTLDKKDVYYNIQLKEPNSICKKCNNDKVVDYEDVRKIFYTLSCIGTYKIDITKDITVDIKINTPRQLLCYWMLTYLHVKEKDDVKYIKSKIKDIQKLLKKEI